MSKRIILLSVLAICVGIFTGCKETVEEPSGKPVVYVSVPPYQSIAKRLAGDAFEVRTIVSESDDPHGFSPTPRQVTQLSQAAIFFTGEMPFESTIVEKVSEGNSKIKIFSLTENVNLLEGSCEVCAHGDDDEVFTYVKGQDDLGPAEHDHDHGDDDEVFTYVKGQDDLDHVEHDHDHAEHGHDHAEHDHDHAEHDHHHHEHEHELDPHVWLSPKILKAQATLMAGVLKNASPATASQIDTRLESVLSELDSLDTQLAEKLAFMKGQTFYVYHGAFAYFAEAYGLKQEAIEIGGRRPEPKRLATLIEKAKQDGVKLIFVQPQFDQSSANSIAKAIGGQVLSLDPLEEDIFTNLKKIADTIGQSAL